MTSRYYIGALVFVLLSRLLSMFIRTLLPPRKHGGPVLRFHYERFFSASALCPRCASNYIVVGVFFCWLEARRSEQAIKSVRRVLAGGLTRIRGAWLGVLAVLGGCVAGSYWVSVCVATSRSND